MISSEIAVSWLDANLRIKNDDERRGRFVLSGAQFRSFTQPVQIISHHSCFNFMFQVIVLLRGQAPSTQSKVFGWICTIKMLQPTPESIYLLLCAVTWSIKTNKDDLSTREAVRARGVTEDTVASIPYSIRLFHFPFFPSLWLTSSFPPHVIVSFLSTILPHDL